MNVCPNIWPVSRATDFSLASRTLYVRRSLNLGASGWNCAVTNCCVVVARMGFYYLYGIIKIIITDMNIPTERVASLIFGTLIKTNVAFANEMQICN